MTTPMQRNANNMLNYGDDCREAEREKILKILRDARATFRDSVALAVVESYLTGEYDEDPPEREGWQSDD